MKVTTCIFALLAFVSLSLCQPEDLKSACTNTPISQYSLYLKYACPLISRHQTKCFSQRWMPSSTPKGIVVMFHGYTACPDAQDVASTALQKAGYMVLVPVVLGHGRTRNDCVSKDECANGDPVELLPTDGNGYVAYVDQINKIVAQERSMLPNPNVPVTALGLSLGSGLALVATGRMPSLYDRQMLFSPFLGVSVGPLDKYLHSCNVNDTTTVECVEGFVKTTINSGVGGKIISGVLGPALKTIENILINYLDGTGHATLRGGYAELQVMFRSLFSQMIQERDTFPWIDKVAVDQLLKYVASWGDSCNSARDKYGRGGYCSFLVGDLGAVHTTGDAALAQVRETKSVKTDFITVERDGLTRNSLVWEAGRTLNRTGNSVHLCTFRIKDNCNASLLSNLCGVPHSSFSIPDNIGEPPYKLYWLTDMVNRLVGVVNGTYDHFGYDESFDGQDNAHCYSQDLMNPNPKLVGVVHAHARVYFTSILGNNKERIQKALVEQVSSISGAPSWRIVEVKDWYNTIPTRLEASGTEIMFIMPDFVAQDFRNAVISKKIGKIQGYGFTLDVAGQPTVHT